MTESPQDMAAAALSICCIWNGVNMAALSCFRPCTTVRRVRRRSWCVWGGDVHLNQPRFHADCTCIFLAQPARHMSHVTCHMSHVTCHMSHVTGYTNVQAGGVWRVDADVVKLIHNLKHVTRHTSAGEGCGLRLLRITSSVPFASAGGCSSALSTAAARRRWVRSTASCLPLGRGLKSCE